MNQEIKAAWLAALRSGAYKQGRHTLRYEDKYCCLGVLCDLHAKAGLGTWEGDPHEYGDMFYCGNDGSQDSQILPTAVREWAGLEYSDPAVWGEQRLTQLNDGEEEESEEDDCTVILSVPLVFSQIADLIEECL